MAEQRTRRPHGPMGGPGRGMMPGEKPKDFKNSIEKLVRYLGRYWYAIVAVMIFAAVSTVFSVAGPKVMARDDPEKAKYLEENLAAIPDCVKSLNNY